MPRSRRPLAAGLTYHVTTRGNDKRAIVHDDGDRRWLLRRLAIVVRERAWSLASFCLMTNHLHLLVRTPEPDLSDGMRELLGDHARHVNDRHARVGHLFQGRFHTRHVVHDAHHSELFRYLAQNPVRAELCARPEDFRWSAHRALAGLDAAPAFLDTSLAPFAGDRSRYVAFVTAGSGDLLTDLLGDRSPDRLRAARDFGFTQQDIARATGISQQSVSRRLRE